MTPEQRKWHASQLAHAVENVIPAHRHSWDKERWPNFTPYEISCNGTGVLYVDPEAMDKLQALRDLCGYAFTPTSAYRTEAHNAVIGGATRSMHLLGIAFDVPAIGMSVAELGQLAASVGFKGIGLYTRKNFVHMDARPWREVWGT